MAKKLKRIVGQFRQGDVLIERETKLALGKVVPGPRVVLAHGEVTGHAHEVLEKGAAVLCEITPADRTAIQFGLEANWPVAVTHQEHGPIALEAGKYRVTRQREYLPEGSRNVAD